MHKFKIKKEDEGKRLDIFLKEKYPDLPAQAGLSRSFIQKKIKDGRVKVNGETVAVHRFLKEGDIVEVYGSEGKDGEEGTDGKVNARLFNCSIIKNEMAKLDIISETEYYLVINKPRGMVAHHGDNNTGVERGDFTLTDILLKKYPEIKDVGENPLRPGIVHRLDKDVSGVMVIAKNQDMFMRLKKQFMERTVEKEYIAVVYGIVKKPCGVIDFPIGRSKTYGVKMAARPLNQGGREAATEFTVLKHLAKWTLLSVKIKTGRTHQIRAHMNAYGHPVVGDMIYKPKKLKPTLKFGERLMLHSWHLGFRDLDLAGEWKKFEAELPEEFRRIM